MAAPISDPAHFLFDYLFQYCSDYKTKFELIKHPRSGTLIPVYTEPTLSLQISMLRSQNVQIQPENGSRRSCCHEDAAPEVHVGVSDPSLKSIQENEE
jgi:hypothetical protein